jgi:hypothetical protein
MFYPIFNSTKFKIPADYSVFVKVSSQKDFSKNLQIDFDYEQ